jgi:hypothetical protein
LIALPWTAPEAIARFRQLVALRIPYQLDDCPTWHPEQLPLARTPGNCTIAAIWACGLNIHQVGPGVDVWLNSSGIVSDAKKPGGLFTRIALPRPGCLAVFPWKDGYPGHAGIVTAVNDRGIPTRIIHCSPRNGRDDSVRETGPEVFLARSDLVYAWCDRLAAESLAPVVPIYSPPPAVGAQLGSILPLVIAAQRLRPTLEGLEYMSELPGSFLYIQSDLDLDTDGVEEPGIRYEPTHQRQVAWGGPVNANRVPYIVLPAGFAMLHGIQLGDVAAVLYRDRLAFAVFADVGPRGKIGEGSIQLHRELGFERVGKDGRIQDVGIAGDVVTVVFPGSGDGTTRNPDRIREIGRARWLSLGGRLPERAVKGS